MISSSSTLLAQVPSYFGSWGLQNPTSAKVGALVIGAGLIASLPYAAPFITATTAICILGAGASLIGASLLATAVPLWDHPNSFVRVAAKITTLLIGAGIAASSPITGVTHVFGVSLITAGSIIAGVSCASIAFPPVGRAVTTGLTIASYTLTAISIGAVVLPLIV